MEKQKKIIFLNAGIHDVPLILEAKKIGYYVITSTNKPDYPGHKYSNQFIYCDYNDHDNLVRICAENDITAVSCGTSDTASYHASYLGDFFGWKGHDSLETIKTLHDKGEFKRFTKENNIQAPFSEIYTSEEDAQSASNKISYPVIIKPTDLAGGQGISVAHCQEEYGSAIKKAFALSKGKQIVVEPYLTGTQHSVSTFLVKGKVEAICTWDDLTYPDRYMVSKGSLPASYPNYKHVNSVLVEQVEKIAAILNLEDGLFHLQCIVENGEPYIIEVMRRAPGNWDTCLASLATGLDWNQWIVRAEAGEDCSEFPKGRRQSGFWGYYCILSEKNGTLKDIIVDDSVKENIVRFDLWENEGHVISDYQHDKLGLVHLRFSSREEMNEKMVNIDTLIKAVCK